MSNCSLGSSHVRHVTCLESLHHSFSQLAPFSFRNCCSVVYSEVHPESEKKSCCWSFLWSLFSLLLFLVSISSFCVHFSSVNNCTRSLAFLRAHANVGIVSLYVLSASCELILGEGYRYLQRSSCFILFPWFLDSCYSFELLILVFLCENYRMSKNGETNTCGRNPL